MNDVVTRFLSRYYLNIIYLLLFVPTVSLSFELKESEKYLSPDFSETVSIELGTDRKNIYHLEESVLKAAVKSGKLHAMSYPVDTTGLTLPLRFMEGAIEGKIEGVGGVILNPLSKIFSPWKSMEELYQWIGLSRYPEEPGKNIEWNSPYKLPAKSKLATDYLGATHLKVGDEKALTFSCASCHVGNLFGTPVVGLTNKTPRAFDFIDMGVRLRPALNPHIAGNMAGLNKEERDLLKNTYESVRYIRTKKPIHESLDTSLAIVGLSLSKRSLDDTASRNPRNARRPRPTPLRYKVVDSKPMVWWNLKYKTRWLSDGSVVSGNPIFTNFLWNEIGRGSDLTKLESWFDDNQKTVDDLTAMVFASEAPRYLDFYNDIDLPKAESGRRVFNETCARCHGIYTKNWENISEDEWGDHSLAELIKTTKVIYHQKTPVIDVGTDPNRYEGMKYFADDLNRLRLSKKFGTKVMPQKGYVPPPLVGVWARWPYLHNNSVASLCDLLKPSSQRPEVYYGVPSKDKLTDFDTECLGYPISEKIIARTDAVKFDSSKEGLSNSGHDAGILIRDGEEVLTENDKSNLIEYLKTL